MVDVETIAGFIRETAAQAILPRFRQLRQEDIREKKPGDFVTIADLEAEQMLTERLLAAMPGSVVLGEEAAAKDPARLALLAGEAPVWVIDPIDGTANFARGEPGFAVILALVERAEVRAGWIYDPLGDTMVLAERGSGAWSQGRRLAVDGEASAERMTGAAYGRTIAGPRAAKALGDSGRVARCESRQQRARIQCGRSRSSAFLAAFALAALGPCGRHADRRRGRGRRRLSRRHAL